MSYEPTNWQTGDIVSSQRLNKIEQGIAGAGGVLVVHDVDGTLDKTWQEIADADFCVLKLGSSLNGETLFNFAYPNGVAGSLIGGEYFVSFFAVTNIGTTFDDPLQYITDTASGYPTLNDGPIIN